MSARDLEGLRSAHDTLLSQYQEHLEDVRALQRVVNEDILPGVLDELRLELIEEEQEEVRRLAREWIEDEGV
jgi:hypothetical protein